VELRSNQWYEGDDRNAYIHRAWMRRGVPGDAFTGRPQIAIANTASDLTPCNAHLTEVAASVRDGVHEAGGIPLELPVVSLGETHASTMALVAEALGTVVPGVAGTPAPDSRLLEAAHGAGRLAVEMIAAGRRPSTFLTKSSFHNAIVALAAIGGSTNAVVHLLAIAGRLGVDLTVDDFDRIGSRVPVLVDLLPAGRFLMDDFHRAGGLLAVLREVRDLLDPTALTVTGTPLLDYLDDVQIWDAEVIRPRAAPLVAEGGIAVLRGNLAPGGALIKPAAASPHLLRHRGRAVVFDSIEDFHARIDDPDADADADSVLVLRGCGPQGYPGMPEVSNMPLPTKLLEQGVRDMVRICDGRMSGTAYGTVVLHVTPEAAAGGPLALVQTGDPVVLDVEARRIDIDIPADELARRTPNPATVAGFATPQRGWERLYVDHVQQADTGVDLDFLVGSSGSAVSRESH
jgi:dihydroxyacid dehydratase/phosphogluconate dehydratase